MRKNRSVLKVEAMNVLLKTFGVLETERFISSIKSNNFDYTEWRKDLWKDKSIEEIHEMATEFENKKDKSIEKSHSPGRSFR
jgi:hypothetical protein